MNLDKGTLIYAAGIGQLLILTASALAPLRLKWTQEFAGLPPLIRQLFWIYGGYTVMTIISLGVVCIAHSHELSAGSPLARSICAYGAIFWGVRISLQPFLHAKPYLTNGFLFVGYHTLTIMFAALTIIFAWAAIS